MLIVLFALCAIVLRDHDRQDGASLNARARAATPSSDLSWRVVIAGMVGLSFAAIPLYRLFCAATGYGGTPKIGLAAPPGPAARSIRVRFNADTNPGLPWTFAPDQLEITLKLGDEQVAFYHARQPVRPTPVTGMALYNVTPGKSWQIFPQDRLFLLQPADPGAEAEHGISRQLLGRSGDPDRSRTPPM